MHRDKHTRTNKHRAQKEGPPFAIPGLWQLGFDSEPEHSPLLARRFQRFTSCRLARCMMDQCEKVSLLLSAVLLEAAFLTTLHICR
jgi:hypothetical protein